MKKKTKDNNGVIDIDSETQKDLFALNESRKDISRRMEIIFRTYLNAHGKKGEYQIDRTFTKLIPVIKKESKENKE